MNIYAHRGNSGFFPENTMYAFKKSLDLGIYGIEIDVQKTKDGILVVHHDETLGRMFDGKGSIKKSTFEQLRELNLKDEELKNKADCKIPTLEEVLEFIKDTDLTLNIEIKNNKVRYKNIEKKPLNLFIESNKLSKLDTLNDMLKEIKLEKSKIEQEIQQEMKDHEVAFIGDRKITWKWQSRTTLDSKRLKKDYPDIVKDYMKTTETRVFKVN